MNTRLRTLLLFVAVLAAAARPAHAADPRSDDGDLRPAQAPLAASAVAGTTPRSLGVTFEACACHSHARTWPVSFEPAAPTASPRVAFVPVERIAASAGAADDVSQTAAPPPVAFEYSHGYEVRNRIHHIASYATLPLFGAEVYLGQNLFNHPDQITPAKRHLHGTIAMGIVGLFGVNSVTGVWNLLEARKDPQLGMLPVVHGVLMLVADAGFVATTLTRPNSRTAAGAAVYTPKANQHLTLAYASISTATVGYLLMLFHH